LRSFFAVNIFLSGYMNTHLHDPIHARHGALAEPTRTRLLLLLARHELSVGELCGAVQLPQSTVSRHLRVLLDEGWVVSRPDGQSRYYRLATELEPNAQRLWQVVGDAVSASVEAEQDAVRAQQAVRERRTRSQEFFSTAASDWETVHYRGFSGCAYRGINYHICELALDSHCGRRHVPGRYDQIFSQGFSGGLQGCHPCF
jgi:DNA-binding transcriptional ArsR family regulator